MDDRYHCINGETLPDPVIAGDTYTDVCQTFLSNCNEMFVITGSSRDSNPAKLRNYRQSQLY